MPNRRVAETIRKALEPETRAARGFRSVARVASQGRRLELDIAADDLAALRAASNSFLHFASASLKAIQSVAPFYRGRGDDAPGQTA